MKKLIRFILALIISPLMLCMLALDWIYNVNDTPMGWKKHITFNDW